MIQACTEKVREELFDGKIEELKAQKAAEAQKSAEALEADYRLAFSCLHDVTAC